MRTTIVTVLACMLALPALARDSGQYAQVDPAIREWFNGLRSQNSVPCCSMADGETILDSDWEIVGDHYRVRIDGKWIDVPREAVITVPNRIGVPVVWPVRYQQGIYIRCFMPGAGL
jgi:hypothetical protein